MGRESAMYRREMATQAHQRDWRRVPICTRLHFMRILEGDHELCPQGARQGNAPCLFNEVEEDQSWYV